MKNVLEWYYAVAGPKKNDVYVTSQLKIPQLLILINLIINLFNIYF
jgi:hypothetical protein